jgi:hypothetical protein
MTQQFQIEAGAEQVNGHCACCGRETRTFRGFIYEHGTAAGIYVARYTQSHPEVGVSMAISLGGWGRADSSKDCVALEWRDTDAGPSSMVVDAGTSIWATSAMLGHMLSREQVVSSSLAKRVFAVIDSVWAADSRLAGAVASCRTP